MSTEAKTNYASTLILILLGLLALYAAAGWLMVLVPAAILVWYGAEWGTFKRSRN
jgi:CDP-diglyceride synthetase